MIARMSDLQCVDCEKIMENCATWEPVLVPLGWGLDTGRHAALCSACIADVYACQYAEGAQESATMSA